MGEAILARSSSGGGAPFEIQEVDTSIFSQLNINYKSFTIPKSLCPSGQITSFIIKTDSDSYPSVWIGISINTYGTSGYGRFVPMGVNTSSSPDTLSFIVSEDDYIFTSQTYTIAVGNPVAAYVYWL